MIEMKKVLMDLLNRLVALLYLIFGEKAGEAQKEIDNSCVGDLPQDSLKEDVMENYAFMIGTIMIAPRKLMDTISGTLYMFSMIVQRKNGFYDEVFVVINEKMLLLSSAMLRNNQKIVVKGELREYQGLSEDFKDKSYVAVYAHWIKQTEEPDVNSVYIKACVHQVEPLQVLMKGQCCSSVLNGTLAIVGSSQAVNIPFSAWNKLAKYILHDVKPDTYSIKARLVSRLHRTDGQFETLHELMLCSMEPTNTMQCVNTMVCE